MPVESGEKVSLSITIMLSYSVLLLVISDVTPRSGSGQPYLGNSSFIESVKLFRIDNNTSWANLGLILLGGLAWLRSVLFLVFAKDMKIGNNFPIAFVIANARYRYYAPRPLLYTCALEGCVV